MKEVLKRSNQTQHNSVVVNDVCLNDSQSRQASPVDEFYQLKSVSSIDGKNVTHFVDPIYMLFNQQRLESTLGIETAKQFLDSLMQKQGDPLTELRSRCSDEDIVKTIKSRHLQSPSEILNWARYCERNIDKFNVQVQKAVDAYNAQQQQETSTE